MGYWGLGTPGTRLAWGMVISFVLIGAAFWIPGLLQYKRCFMTYQRCMCRSTMSGQIQCLDPQQAQNMTAAAVCNEALGRCRKGPVAMWAIGWLFLVVLSWVPCFYFCCCAQDPKPPASSVAYQNGTLQMAPVVDPAQHFTTQPFAAQPYGAMPYSYPQASVGYPPTTGYPVASGTPIPGYPSGSVPYQQQQLQQQQQQPSQQLGGVPVHRV